MTITGVSQVFVDTNVLIYATNSASSWYQLADQTLHDAHRQGIELVISPQILREYIAAATRPASQMLPLSTILANIHTFQTGFRLIEDNAQVSARLVQLVTQVSVAGKQVHDANIVATMQTHGISHLLTHNIADFNRFGHLITIVPLVQP